MNNHQGSAKDSVRGVAVFVLGYALVDLLPLILPGHPRILGLPLHDAADAALIFLLVFLYVELASHARVLQRRWARAVFALALLLMVQGHAIHLAANAIAAAVDPEAEGWTLIYFLDEHWGHTELHISYLLLAALFIGRASGEGDVGSLTRADKVSLWVLAVVYGLLIAGAAVEGQTAVPLMLPCGLLLGVWGMWPHFVSPKQGRAVPIQRLFFSASLGVVALALMVYGTVMRGFPQLSGG